MLSNPQQCWVILLYEKFSYALHKVRLPSQVLQHEGEHKHEHIDKLWKAGEVKKMTKQGMYLDNSGRLGSQACVFKHRAEVKHKEWREGFCCGKVRNFDILMKS